MTLDEWLRQSALPKNEARMLLQYALSYTRAQLVTRGTDDLAESALQTLETLAQRRLKGEPMAYLLGEREFYGRRFAVNPHVLIPRPETEHLVEAVLKRLPPQGRVWDLGTGSGAIAVTSRLNALMPMFAHPTSASVLWIPPVKMRQNWVQKLNLRRVRGLIPTGCLKADTM